MSSYFRADDYNDPIHLERISTLNMFITKVCHKYGHILLTLIYPNYFKFMKSVLEGSLFFLRIF